eukprot:scaffold12194_cov129-Cylindrotheca_fusiformis.AAC.10
MDPANRRHRNHPRNIDTNYLPQSKSKKLQGPIVESKLRLVDTGHEDPLQRARWQLYLGAKMDH